MIEIVRSILACLLLAAFVWAAASNLALAILALLKRWRGSLVPIVGGVLGLAGCLISPWPLLRAWCWVPPLVDLGCLPLIASTLFWLAFRPKDQKP